MTDVRALASRILRRAARAGRALRDDARATAAVEAALILPIAMTMFALLLYGAEAFAIQRKVTLTARTVTDLITQRTTTMVNSLPSIPQTCVDNDLSVASSVLTPYAAANLSMLASEVKVNSDQATAIVQWSEPYNGATPRTKGSTMTLPTGLGTGQAGNYLVMGEVYYQYTPLTFFTPAAALTLHDAIYLTPRTSASITLVTGACSS
jgi:Flp pilus assembly protein TadG